MSAVGLEECVVQIAKGENGRDEDSSRDQISDRHQEQLRDCVTNLGEGDDEPGGGAAGMELMGDRLQQRPLRY